LIWINYACSHEDKALLESNLSASVAFIRKTADEFRRFFIAVKHKAINSVFPSIATCFHIVSLLKIIKLFFFFRLCHRLMFLQIQEPAVRVFTISAPITVSQTAMFRHAIVAYQPVIPKVTGTRNKVARVGRQHPSHFTAAYLAVNRLTLHHRRHPPDFTDFNAPMAAI